MRVLLAFSEGEPKTQTISNVIRVLFEKNEWLIVQRTMKINLRFNEREEHFSFSADSLTSVDISL